MHHFEIEQGLSKLVEKNQRLDKPGSLEASFTQLFQHGSLEIEFFKPDQVDLQQPHQRDEVYCIALGSGVFEHEQVRTSVKPGDVLFVPAGDEHRFVDFTDDFATWVFFYGPIGGEAAKGE